MASPAELRLRAKDETKQGLQSAENNLNRLANTAQGAFSLIGKVGLGVAGVFGVIGGAAAAATAKHAAYAQEVQRIAQITSTSTQFVSEMGFAMKRAGLESDDLRDAIATMSEQLGDAIEGSDEQIKRFQRFGLEVKELQRLSPEEVFERVADGFSQIEDPAARTFAIMELFGGDIGNRLIPVMEGGAAGLREMREEARALGLSLDEEAAEGAVRFQDNLRRIQGVVQGVGHSIGNALIPPLNDLIERAFPYIQRGLEFITPLFTWAGEGVAWLGNQFFNLINEATGFLERTGVLSGLQALQEAFFQLSGEGGPVEELRLSLSGLWEAIQFAIGPAVTWLGEQWDAFWRFINEHPRQAITNIVTILQGWAEFMSEIFIFIGNVLRGDWAGAWNSLLRIAGRGVDLVEDVFRSFGETIRLFFPALDDPFVNSFIDMMNLILQYAESGFEGVLLAGNKMATALLSIISKGLVGQILNLFGPITPILQSLGHVGLIPDFETVKRQAELAIAQGLAGAGGLDIQTDLLERYTAPGTRSYPGVQSPDHLVRRYQREDPDFWRWRTQANLAIAGTSRTFGTAPRRVPTFSTAGTGGAVPGFTPGNPFTGPGFGGSGGGGESQEERAKREQLAQLRNDLRWATRERDINLRVSRMRAVAAQARALGTPDGDEFAREAEYQADQQLRQEADRQRRRTESQQRSSVGGPRRSLSRQPSGGRARTGDAFIPAGAGTGGGPTIIINNNFNFPNLVSARDQFIRTFQTFTESGEMDFFINSIIQAVGEA